MDNVIVTNYSGLIQIYRGMDLPSLIREVLTSELDFTPGLDNPDLSPEILDCMANPTIEKLKACLLAADVEIECDLHDPRYEV